MIEAWARRLLNRRFASWVVLVSLLLSAAGGFFAARVQHDDDLLAFLPQGNADVLAFTTISERFGGLEIALVGVEGDPLEPQRFAAIQAFTHALDQTPEVNQVLSLANVEDFQPSAEGGITVDRLVPAVPDSVAERAALREKVLSRDLVVGRLIAPAGDGALIYVFGSHGTNPKALANVVQEAAVSHLGQQTVHLGGAPFVSAYIFETVQADLARLVPWAVLAILVLVFWSFRDLWGVMLALLSTSMGIAIALGLMGLLGVPYNIVLSSMPVILFSLGSAYAIHVLARFYQLAARHGRDQALVESLARVGPTVLAAGLTTVAGLASFLVMDVAPLRIFGLFTALGILATLLLSLSFVPAMVVLLQVGAKRVAGQSWSHLLVTLVEAVRRHRALVMAGLALLAILGVRYVFQVDSRMDQRAFYGEASRPARADAFLARHFATAQFIQIHLKGDFEDPEALRELEWLADRIRVLDDVTGVEHVGQVLAQVNHAMESVRAIPRTADQVRLLYRLTAGVGALDQLVTSDHQEAMLHVRLGTADLDRTENVLSGVEALVGAQFPLRAETVATTEPDALNRRNSRLEARLVALARAEGWQWDHLPVTQLQDATEIKIDTVTEALQRHLGSVESLVDFGANEALMVAVAQAAADGDLATKIEPVVRGQTLGGLSGAALVEDLVVTLQTAREEAFRRARGEARLEQLLAATGASLSANLRGERAKDAFLGALAEFDRAVGWIVRPSAPEVLSARVSGLPVLNRGLSESAERNQWMSLALALGLVLLILIALYRSLFWGVLATLPTLYTLIAVYGGMGWLGIHLDIGTSMLASLIIGAGVDYAVHLASALRAARGPNRLEEAVLVTGPAIWTNALMVAVGFWLLTLGEARPLRNVGGLTAAAMFVAALATFLIVPVFYRARGRGEA